MSTEVQLCVRITELEEENARLHNERAALEALSETLMSGYTALINQNTSLLAQQDKIMPPGAAGNAAKKQRELKVTRMSYGQCRAKGMGIGESRELANSMLHLCYGVKRSSRWLVANLKDET